MRRQISVLVGVISTAIVASFVIPLLLLVGTLAGDRAMAVGSQQANSVAMLVSSLHDDPRLADVLQPSLTASPAATSVVLADGRLVGAPWPGYAVDPAYQRAREGQAFSERGAAGGQVYVPVVVDGGVAVVRATVTPDQLTQGVPLAWISIIALGVGLSAVAVFVAAQVGRGVSRPLLAVAETAHRLREGDLAARAPLSGPPETIELGSALNRLAERIDQLLATERDSVRGLAHRLRTPVTALRLEAERVDDPESKEVLTGLIGHLQVAIDGVVAEARRPLREDLPAGCDAVAVVADRIGYWRPLAEDQGRRVDLLLPPEPLRVAVSALELAEVVDVCVDNIFAHTDDGVGFAVELERTEHTAVLRIADEGAGFPVAPPERRAGTTGLGLQLARRSAERWHGSVSTSAPGRAGAEVRIEIPLREAAS